LKVTLNIGLNIGTLMIAEKAKPADMVIATSGSITSIFPCTRTGIRRHRRIAGCTIRLPLLIIVCIIDLLDLFTILNLYHMFPRQVKLYHAMDLLSE